MIEAKLLSLAHANAGRRVLILCHSNAAVEDMVKALSDLRDERYPELVIEHFAGLSSYHRQAYIVATNLFILDERGCTGSHLAVS